MSIFTLPPAHSMPRVWTEQCFDRHQPFLSPNNTWNDHCLWIQRGIACCPPTYLLLKTNIIRSIQVLKQNIEPSLIVVLFNLVHGYLQWLHQPLFGAPRHQSSKNDPKNQMRPWTIASWLGFPFNPPPWTQKATGPHDGNRVSLATSGLSTSESITYVISILSSYIRKRIIIE